MHTNLLFYLLVVLCVSLGFVVCLTPVVIVPGIGGSQIQAKLDRNKTEHYWCYKKYDSWFTIWFSIQELLPLAEECWVDNLKLAHNSTTGKMQNTDGVITRIPDFGNTSAIEWLDPAVHGPGIYFFPFVDSLCLELGYERGKTLRAAPYDFRYDPGNAGDYFDRLRKIIEDTYYENGDQQVMLVSHSMGTPYSLYFLHHQTQEWKDTFIKAWTTISGVYAGAVKAVKAFVSGDGFGIPSLLDKPRRLRRFERTFSSIAFILPDSRFWKDDEVLVKTVNKSYTVNDYDDLFKDMGYPVGSKILKTVPKAWSPKPPNVKMFCFHGKGIPTVGSLKYAKDDFPDYSPDIEFVDGDKTVTMRSLQACLLWKKKQKQPIVYKNFDGADHNGILSDARLIRSVIEALKD